jgi:anti-sigma-K factor RskA
MPDVVNAEDLRALAAEFVLGTLASDERARANELLNSDEEFRGLVRTWERRFGELHLMVEPVEPPASVWDRIKGKIKGVEPTAETNQPEMPLEVSAPLEAPAAAESELTLDALEAELRLAGIAGADPVVDRPETPVVDRPETGEPKAVTSPEITPQAAEPIPLMPAAIAPDQVEEPVALAQHRQPAREPHSSVRRWRLAAILMAIVALALAALVMAWRYAPERLPSQLQATNFLNLRRPAPPPSSAPVRPTAPAESRFDE